MFSWHETTLRGLCRLAFGLLVAAPTCAVLLAVVWCRCPLSVAYHRRALSEQLALDVQLDRVSFPRPNVTVFQGLSLADPETARPLARFAALEWRTKGQKTSVVCSRAELLDSSRLDLLSELVARRLRSFAGSKTVIEIQAQELILSLADGSGPQALTRLRGQWQSEPIRPKAPRAPSEPQATVEFHLKGQEASAPARISFYREATPQGALTSTKIETGPTPLEARLIELCCPGWATWGAQSTFCGELWWQQRADGPAGEVRGRISSVDLDSLVSTRSEHRLTGVAEVQLDRARFQQGRLLEAAGSIHAGPGLVGRSLLADAAFQLKASINNSTAARSDQAPYKLLACEFSIGERGLIIRGLCPESKGAVILGQYNESLLGQPIGPQPLLGVVRLLATSGQSVPADAAAQSLLRLLPLPAADPSSLDAPRARLEKAPLKNVLRQ